MNKKEFLNLIDKEVLRELCMQYDIENQEYPESPYEGLAIYNFFIGKEKEIDYGLWVSILKEIENNGGNFEE